MPVTPRPLYPRIALAYVLSSGLMLLAGFGMVLIMRWQLAYPGTPVPGLAALADANHPWFPGGILLPNFYNQLAGMHGTVMVFLAVVPLLVGGFGNYLVPRMIGARDLAFPRIGLAGLAFQLLGIVLIAAGFFTTDGPAATGWTAYAPLSSIEPSGQTLWLLGIAMVYFSSLFLSINLIVTIVACRVEGMLLFRMPFFVWTQLITALLLLLSFPPLTAAAVLQLMDRLRGTSFFVPSGLFVSGQAMDSAGGGSALLWQHLFWFLAHPEVYVLLLPALGVVAEVYTSNARRGLHGYRFLVGALLALGLLSMLVWAHHMYLTGMGVVMSSFFQATTVIISLPSIAIGMGLLLTLWGGYLHFTMPMVFALGFLPMFALGGFTGLPLALGVTNVPLHDTNYVVGHFHYIAAPGILFAMFAGIYHWFPMVTGKKLSSGLGHAHFWPTLIGMNGVFLPMMIQGLAGVNRRLYDGGISYAHGTDLHFLQVASTHSALLLAAAQLPFFINLIWTLGFRGTTESNPWLATTLEWQSAEAVIRVDKEPYRYQANGTIPELQAGVGLSPYREQSIPFEKSVLGTGLLLISLFLFMAALWSSMVLLRESSSTWPHLEFSFPWWISRSVALFVLLGLLVALSRAQQAHPIARLIPVGLAIVAAYCISQEHAVVFNAHQLKAAAHNGYALYYLLTGVEGVFALFLAALLLVIGLRVERGYTSPAAYRNLAAGVSFLLGIWIVNLVAFSVINSGATG